MKKDAKFFLMHIIESIQFIEDYTKGLTFEDFKNSQEKQDSIFMRLTIIGEATKNVPDDIKAKHKDIPWGDMAGLRDVIVHNYFGVELEDIWKTIKEDLPPVKKQVKGLLENL